MDNISQWIQENPTGLIIIFVAVTVIFLTIFCIFGARKRKADKAKTAAMLAAIPNAAIVIFEADVLAINGTLPKAEQFIKKQYDETYYLAPGTYDIRLEINRTEYGQHSTRTIKVKPSNLELMLEANKGYIVDFNEMEHCYRVREKKIKRPGVK